MMLNSEEKLAFMTTRHPHIEMSKTVGDRQQDKLETAKRSNKKLKQNMLLQKPCDDDSERPTSPTLFIYLTQLVKKTVLHQVSCFAAYTDSILTHR